MEQRIAKVAVESTVYSFDKEYDYRIPEMMLECAKPGCRVTVPFGRGNNIRFGLITSLCRDSDNAKLKCIEAVLDKAPLISAEMLELVFWLKETTFCTLFEAAKAVLPTGINYKHIVSYSTAPGIDESLLNSLSQDQKQLFNYIKSRKGFVRRDLVIRSLGFSDETDIPEKLLKIGLITRNVDAVRNVGDLSVRMVRLKQQKNDDALADNKLTQKQKAVIDLLMEIGSASVKEICYFTGLTPSVVLALEKKDAVELFENPVNRKPYLSKNDKQDKKIIELTLEQKKAYENLLEQYKSNKGETALLFGITGSGKTLVYLKLIDAITIQGRGVIVMVPEIALTPQALAIFNKRYGDRIAVFHSALSVGERADEWRRVKNGDASIVIGTRSAVFAPFENIGLIIIDEEQEPTYKSEKAPRYNAKNVARYRCKKHKALLLLSSATPSIETYAAAKEGRYSLNILRNRFGKAIIPEVLTVDMRNEAMRGNASEISEILFKSLSENLDSKKQSILMINRRGYNTFVACRACGNVVACPSCSISMRYHNTNKRLMCHYCGFSTPFTDTCSNCGKKDVRYSGFGTQKIEDEISVLLPQARILRMDTDTTMTRFSHEKKFEQFANKEFDIMLGTQMVAKGLDFESVTLVGVVSIDQQLYNDDYRSMESAFALLTQVVGRSGRGRYEGRAIIQTFTPENEIIRLAAKQDYDSFFQTEIQIRKMLTYPPYCDICLVCFAGEDESKVKAAAGFLFQMLRVKLGNDYKGLKLIVLGPMPARVIKVSNKFRYRLVIKCHNSTGFRQLMSELLIAFENAKGYNGVSIFADINPENMI
jgi:primosomal protein N' (replication factor Y) (superfamily II helicase)